MGELNDEMIMALIDGELDATTAVRVKALIERTPEAHERYQMFQRTGRQLAEPFDPILDEPVPPHLIQMIAAAEIGEPQTRGAAQRVQEARSPFYKRFSAYLAGHLSLGTGMSWQQAVAYGIVLFCGVGAGALLAGVRSGGEKQETVAMALVAPPPLAAVLESAASGSDVALRGLPGVSAVPRLTFRTADGAYCRQYKEMGPGGAFDGVACRDGGIWHIRAHVPGVPLPQPDVIVPAGDSTVVDDLVDGMIAGEVLSADEEAGALGKHWPSTAAKPQ